MRFFSFQSDIQAPLNRQIIKSSETVMYAVDLLNNLLATFLGPPPANPEEAMATSFDLSSFTGGNNDLGKTDNQPRGLLNANTVGNVIHFAKTIYSLMK